MTWGSFIENQQHAALCELPQERNPQAADGSAHRRECLRQGKDHMQLRRMPLQRVHKQGILVSAEGQNAIEDL